MKTLTNKKLIAKRIEKIAKVAPKFPVKGLGHKRMECNFERVAEKFLKKLAPAHVETVMECGRGAYGKIVYIPMTFVSMELGAVIEANKEDFRALETAYKTIEEFGI